jgi:hypothetical protein
MMYALSSHSVLLCSGRNRMVNEATSDDIRSSVPRRERPFGPRRAPTKSPGRDICCGER